MNTGHDMAHTHTRTFTSRDNLDPLTYMQVGFREVREKWRSEIQAQHGENIIVVIFGRLCSDFVKIAALFYLRNG